MISQTWNVNKKGILGSIQNLIAQSAGAVEYTDCTPAGK